MIFISFTIFFIFRSFILYIYERYVYEKKKDVFILCIIYIIYLLFLSATFCLNTGYGKFYLLVPDFVFICLFFLTYGY